ncbi:CatB-related O-acetyltransferase [Methylobacterium sp. A49B]
MPELTASQLERLRKTKISFSWYDDAPLWIEEGINALPRPGVFAEDYACYFLRTDFHTIGAFSYSWSPFPDFVSIGRYCSIADGIELIPFTHPTDLFTTSSMTYDSNLAPRRKYYADQSFDNNDAVSRSHPSNDKDLLIGHDVYISRGAKLRRGIRIGTGAIVGAFSVVTKDVAPYSVVAGNPARVVRMRYSDKQIETLQTIEWWNYDFHSVLNKTHIADIDLFVDRLQHLISTETIEPFRPQRNYLHELLTRSDDL